MRYVHNTRVAERSVASIVAVVSMAGMLAIVMLMSALLRTATATGSTVVVTPDNMVAQSWYFFDDTANTPDPNESSPNYEFTAGSGTPPLGDASISFELTGASERWNIATNQFAGAQLSDLSALSFDMYTPNTSAGGVSTTLFLNIDVDFDNTTTDGYQGRLVYVPGDNGTPSLDTWETWDALDTSAQWRWSGYAANGNMWPDGETDMLRTTSDVVAAFPDAEVFNESFTGQLLVRAGHPGPVGLQGSVDNIVVNDTAYDFEEVYPVYGMITAPTAGETVNGTVDLLAMYNDGDTDNDDAVNWAVRSGTCAAGTGTVAGNVDGFSDVAAWDGADFSYALDTTALMDGDYCFIFNPTDDPGQSDVRETVEFSVDNSVLALACDGDYDNVIELTVDGQSIKGTSGDDYIKVTGTRNSVRGRGGNDCIIIEGSNNSARGNGGQDAIIALDGGNSLRGGRHNDYLEAGPGSSLRGNGGTDTCVVDASQSSVRSCEL